MRPSVVQIATGSGSGSGVIFDVSSATAWIVTNHHVVEGSSHVRVLVNDANWFDATVHGVDRVRDLAVLSICCSPSFRAAELAGQRVRQGANVFAMGYPLGVDSSVLTSGIVSRVFQHSPQNAWMVQTDAPINPGNSGGPLFNMDGNVVGINTFVVRESESEVSVEGFGFAVAAESVRGVLAVLKQGQSSSIATPTPRPRATPTPGRNSTRSYGPQDGALPHDNDEYIEQHRAGVYLNDLTARVTFQNPYASSVGEWDYGFTFRAGEEASFHAVVVTSEGRWLHYLREGSADRDSDPIAQGRASSLLVGVGRSNELRLVAAGDLGWFFINDRLAAALDLSGGDAEGDVAVITGYHEGNEIDGRSARFTGFAVSEPWFIGNCSGELEHNDDGLIKWEELPTNERDFIVAATFVNPYEGRVGDWDYGFMFRSTGSSTFHAATVDSDGWWMHFLRRGSTEPVYETSGRATLNLGANGQNALFLLAVGGAGVLHVNGVQVAELDLSGHTASGAIAVGTGFYEGNETPGYNTSYDDCAAWSLD
ncbi:MAG: trypsin-like peptidase domain-containing protein [Chloroflexi bacterium]|nr:trypsin-like peptidase domain-containing protein [Chloroflexota bacterium]